MSSEVSIPGLITGNAELQAAAALIDRVAPTPVSVLILGETGTGKELLARAVHERSGRPGRFVPVDCGALPEHLVEALLFGHTRGAFTGANAASEGLFRYADGGTLFLDEIGNLPLRGQLSLLRVLQERLLRPVGGAEEIPVDVRIVAATREDLEAAVREGRFREDLLFRLNVIQLVVPPLRQRPEDIPRLFDHFLGRLCARHGVAPPRIDPALVEALREHAWPGNVRQLENLVERLVLTRAATAGELVAADLTRSLGQTQASTPPATRPMVRGEPAPGGPAARTLEEAVDLAERSFLERLLEEHGGRMEDAARAGAVSRRTLQRKLRKHGLDRRTFDSGQESGPRLWLLCPPFAPLRLEVGLRIVGRDPASDLCLPHPQVSRLHLELEVTEDEVWARDMDSANGTLLNGAALAERTRLAPSDELEVGPFQLTVLGSPANDEDTLQDDTSRVGRVRSVELAPGRLEELLAELRAGGGSATIHVRSEAGLGGLWIEGGAVVRAWFDDQQGEAAQRALAALEVGQCQVSEFIEQDGEGLNPAPEPGPPTPTA
ncbi:MAG: sigma 54-interacting transcriptional regulator [Planctomycetota bacterium]